MVSIISLCISHPQISIFPSCSIPPLALLQYLRQFGNPWRQLIRIQAIIGGSRELVENIFHFCTKIRVCGENIGEHVRPKTP
jgi:hypothetical protein